MNVMSNERHAFTMSKDEFSSAPRSRRRVSTLLTFLVVAATLIAVYDLLVLALGV